jgi:hypothetical protein
MVVSEPQVACKNGAAFAVAAEQPDRTLIGDAVSISKSK